jgi:hypothetical protein
MGGVHAKDTPATGKVTPLVHDLSVSEFLERLNDATQEELGGSCCDTCGRPSSQALLDAFAQGNLADVLATGKKPHEVFVEGMRLCCTGHDEEVVDEMPDVPAKA